MLLNWLLFINAHDRSWSTPPDHVPHPNLPKLLGLNLPNLPKIIKCVKAQWVAPNYSAWWVEFEFCEGG